MTETAERLAVGLGERTYDILVDDGLLDRAGHHMAPVLARPRVIVVTDETVAPLYLERLGAALDAAGIAWGYVVMPAGEGTKSFAHLEDLVERVLDLGLERHDTLVALGGGVIGDLVGFAASILLRGVDFAQVPTTLLAQVDSSVGGKTGINTAHGKNLAGTFHQPRLVLADTATLDTLPPREARAGYAEVVKYGLIDRPAFFDWLAAEGHRVLAGDRAARRHAVATSCAAKAAVVAADERETGMRALLNLGHTFAHAFEAETGYSDALLHGEAVALGLVLAARLSARTGLCDAAVPERVADHLRAVGLPADPAEVPGAPFHPDTLMAHMASDKKVAHGRLTFILLRGIGAAFRTRDVDPAAVRAVLAES